MELNDFVRQFAEQFDNTPDEQFNPDTTYRELDEWGSLIALSVIAMVDEEYDKQITGADIKSVKTIKELYELVKSR